jgi:hypothetical protein
MSKERARRFKRVQLFSVVLEVEAVAEDGGLPALRRAGPVDVMWDFRKLTVGKFDRLQVSGMSVL